MKAIKIVLFMAVFFVIAVIVRHLNRRSSEPTFEDTYKKSVMGVSSDLFAKADEFRDRNAPTSFESLGTWFEFMDLLSKSMNHSRKNLRLESVSLIDAEGPREWIHRMTVAIEKAKETDTREVGFLTTFKLVGIVMEAEAHWAYVQSIDPNHCEVATLQAILESMDGIIQIRKRFDKERNSKSPHTLGGTDWILFGEEGKGTLMKYVPTLQEIKAKQEEIKLIIEAKDPLFVPAPVIPEKAEKREEAEKPTRPWKNRWPLNHLA